MGSGVSIPRHSCFEDARETLLSAALKKSDASDIFSIAQAREEIKNIRRAIKNIEFDHDLHEKLEEVTKSAEVSVKRRENISPVLPRTPNDDMLAHETILERYRANRTEIRRRERQKQKKIHALGFSLVGRSMLNLIEWRECYCVCRAWKDLLSNDNFWKRRLLRLERSISITTPELQASGKRVAMTMPDVNKLWGTICYRTLACSKMALMMFDDEIVEWKWDKTLVLTSALQLFGKLVGVDPMLTIVLNEDGDELSMIRGSLEYSFKLFTVDLRTGYMKLFRISNEALRVDSTLQHIIDQLSTFVKSDEDDAPAYRLFPLLRIYGMNGMFHKFVYLLKYAMKTKFTGEQTCGSPRAQNDRLGPQSREVFSFKLLACCMRILIASNLPVTIEWGGNHEDLDHQSTATSWNMNSIGSLATSFLFKRRSWIPDFPLFFDSLKRKSAFGQRTAMQKFWALRNSMGEVYMGIDVKSGSVYFTAKNEALGGSAMWNEYVQLQSQNLRQGLGCRAETILHRFALECLRLEIQERNFIRPPSLELVKSRMLHATILAWGHGNIAAWGMDGFNPAKEAASLLFFRPRYVLGSWKSNDKNGKEMELEEKPFLKMKGSHDVQNTTALSPRTYWSQVHSPSVIKSGQDLLSEEKEQRKEFDGYAGKANNYWS